MIVVLFNYQCFFCWLVFRSLLPILWTVPPWRGPEWMDPIQIHQFHLGGLSYDLWKELRDYFTSKHTTKSTNRIVTSWKAGLTFEFMQSKARIGTLPISPNGSTEKTVRVADLDPAIQHMERKMLLLCRWCDLCRPGVTFMGTTMVTILVISFISWDLPLSTIVILLLCLTYFTSGTAAPGDMGIPSCSLGLGPMTI